MVLVLTTYLLIALLTLTLYNFFFADRMEDLEFHPPTDPLSAPFVSILIPARNERHHLEAHLPDLLKTDYPNFEILVLDDDSSDGTRETVQKFAQPSQGRVRLLVGKPLPEGWLGKTWACHQLAGEAKGSLIIFCDADVRASSRAVSRTVAWMESVRLSCLTAWPYQEMVTWAEKAVIPLVMQMSVFSMLPLRKVMTYPSVNLMAANGQWMAFQKEAYQIVGGHESVKGLILADMELGKRIKARTGFRILPVIAAQDLSTRMYQDWEDLREGFTKNLYLLIGASEARLAVFMAAASLALVVPWAWVIIGDLRWGVPLLLLIAIRVLVTRAFRAPWDTLALHPVGSLTLLRLMFESYQGHQGGTLKWKDRPVS